MFVFRYPVALFNELYYLIAGGTIWTGISTTISKYIMICMPCRIESDRTTELRANLGQMSSQMDGLPRIALPHQRRGPKSHSPWKKIWYDRVARGQTEDHLARMTSGSTNLSAESTPCRIVGERPLFSSKSCGEGSNPRPM